MKTKFATIIISAALVLSMCVTAFADEIYTGMWETPVNLDEEIQFIRDTYNYTREHMNEYYSRDMAENIENYTHRYYVNGDSIICNIIIDPEYTVESYSLDPVLGKPQSTQNSYLNIVFIFATDAAGDEHRLYMRDGAVIRYIGPDGIVHDYPYGLSPFDLTDTCGAFSRQMLEIANPGWWGVD